MQQFNDSISETSPKTRERRRAALATDHVADRLRRKIIGSGLPPGTMFDSRRAIAEELGVSLGTVQGAVNVLTNEGYLAPRGNSGTVIGTAALSKRSPESFRITSTARGYVGIVTHIPPERLANDRDVRRTIVRGIERECANLGHPTILKNTYRAAGPQLTAHEAFEEAFISGAEVVIGALLGDDPAGFMAEACHSAWTRRPIVLACSCPLRLPALHCSYDNTSDGYRAAEHLIEAGCSKLLFVSASSRQWSVDRLEGVRTAVDHNSHLGVTLSEHVEHHDEPDGIPHERIESTAQAVIRSGIAFDGVVAANDSCAFAIIDAAREAGRVESRDYAIIGFDDLAEAQERGLTSMCPPIENMGTQSARLAVAALRGEDHPSHVCLRSHLVARLSSQFRK